MGNLVLWIREATRSTFVGDRGVTMPALAKAKITLRQEARIIHKNWEV
jgi:hypothetical protein